MTRSVTIGSPMAEQESSAAIEFVDVSYRTAEGRVLLANLNLHIQRGETLVLLGRSGSGKTTTLKLINGLLVCQDGKIVVDGKSLAEWDLIRLRRHIGYAIQDVGLFPHFTIERNVGLVPQLEKWAPAKIRARTEELLELVGLPPSQFRNRYPNQLSGGQRQRVGLGRALASDPPILLMDEPFGALDPLTRAGIQKEFKNLQQRLNKTVVFVTHDVREAMFLATRIAVLDAGRLLGVYSPAEFLQSREPVVSDYVNVLRSEMELFADLEK
ncbi:MAG TPA: ATP-binding cassette domain-containing protein [Candidatus Angelobacter sp.]|nr:ATP-binding cassette domain-containing protein [Candidatus Angelobacter sp.]